MNNISRNHFIRSVFSGWRFAIFLISCSVMTSAAAYGSVSPVETDPAAVFSDVIYEPDNSSEIDNHGSSKDTAHVNIGPNLRIHAPSDTTSGWVEWQRNTSWHVSGTDEFGLKFRLFRASLFPPLSTNGTRADEYTAKFSLNLLAGVNGGLEKGYEIGLVNIHKHYTHARFQLGAVNYTDGQAAGFNIGVLGNAASGPIQGFQIAGLANASRTDIQGIQLAGLGNFAARDLHGIQFSGLGSMAAGDMHGIQMSGFVNIAGRDMHGIQFSSIANMAGGNMKGIQFGGFVNLTPKEFSGIIMSGVANVSGSHANGIFLTGGANISGGETSGILLSGLGNAAAGDASGIMVAGFGNIAAGDASGILVSGLVSAATGDMSGIAVSSAANISKATSGIAVAGGMNINSGTMTGIQAAGLMNIAHRGLGIQVAPVNLARSFDGLPVGLISLYGDGRRQIDSWSSESGFVFAGLKTGTRHVYNTIGFGYLPTITDRDVFALSWSLGWVQPFNEAWDGALERESLDRFKLIRDITIQHIQDDGWYKSDMSRIYSYRYMIGWEVFGGLTLYGGPTLNMLVGSSAEIDDHYLYSFFDTSGGDYQYHFWIGFSAGLQLFRH